jgi:hypothetical protein
MIATIPWRRAPARRNFWTLAVSLAVAAWLAGCGGGGGGDVPAVLPKPGYGPGNPSGCPHAQLADVWLNNRLGCLAAGQLFIDMAGSRDGTRADRAYVINQVALDENINDVLGGNVHRYFKYALCVRNAPANVLPVQLAGDLQTAVGFSLLQSGTTYLPAGVSGSTLGTGGVADWVLQTPCDPAVHPVIVDYDTGRVESVNGAALATLEIFDL